MATLLGAGGMDAVGLQSLTPWIRTVLVGTAKWRCLHGNQYGNLLKPYQEIYHMPLLGIYQKESNHHVTEILG